jgi:hypothetical protein
MPTPQEKDDVQPTIDPAAVGWFVVAMLFIAIVGLLLASALPPESECWQGMYIGGTRRC